MSFSIVSVTEMVPASPASENETDVTCSREFLVTVSEATYYAPLAALYADTIPNRRDAYPFAIEGVARPICVSKSCAQFDKESRLRWLVSVQYSNKPELIQKVKEENDTDVEPWTRAAKYSYDFTEREVVLEKDLAETPAKVVNTVGDKFDPPLTKQEVLPRVIITRAREVYSQATARGLYNTTNAATVTINGVEVAANMARLVKWSGEQQEWTDEDGVAHYYYEETIEIELATDQTNGFKLQVANTGYRFISNGTPTRIPDITTPAYLNAAGTAYATGASFTPHYLTFTVYASTDWSALDL